jgi:adenylosuccinate lyase
MAEPFGSRQVGSSAMPFKRNPIRSEKINSLARLIAQLPRLAWDNAANSILERTLDDSANRRAFLPEVFLILDEIISTLDTIIRGLQVDEKAIGKNLAIYGGFAATERILMSLTKAGADRQKMHARLRKHALDAWESMRENDINPINQLVLEDPEFQTYLSIEELRNLLKIDRYLGIAPQRARAVAAAIHQTIMQG